MPVIISSSYGARTSAPVGPSLIKASDGVDANYFGTGLAMSSDGNVLAIGDQLWDGTFLNQGAVYLYDKVGSNWVERSTILTAGDAGSGDQFGKSVALSSDGSIMAVGAIGWGGTYSLQGNVYIYDWNGSSWVQRNTITFESPSYEFGSAVALSNDGLVLAVGTIGYSQDRGRVHIYDWNGSSWVQRNVLQSIYTDAANDSFGSAIALSGDGTTLAVGSEGENGNIGAIFIFDWNGSTWIETGLVLMTSYGSSPTPPYLLGNAVALSDDGTILAAGGSLIKNVNNTGAIKIFDRSGNSWNPRPEQYESTSIPSTDRRYGTRVALNGNATLMAVSSPGLGVHEGEVEVFSV